MKRYRSLLPLFLTLAVMAPDTALAVPAAPLTHRLRQSDATSFLARQWGDESMAGWETEDGYTIVSDSDLESWTYADLDRDGNLTSSRRKVGKEPPPGHLRKGLRPAKRRILMEETSPAPAPTGEQASALQVDKTSGGAASVKNIPVILINFNDTIPTYSPADFTSLLFGTSTWSMKDYYEETSGGALSVSAGPVGITGWTTAANPHDYYGRPSGWGPPDALPGDLVFEAVQQSDTAIDYSSYDQNGDCYVDVVAIVHQGPAQEATGNPNDIWSHSWSLSVTRSYGLGRNGPYATNDRCAADPARFVIVDKYIMMPEMFDGTITTIGVFVHEYGHSLGLMDLYDSDSSSEGVGNWSVMGSGSWGGVERLGDRPSHLDPWSKMVLGWASPVRLPEGQTDKVFTAVETGGEVVQFGRTPAQGGSGEYFLLENRQKIGFDEALPGSGLLLWHIDETRANNRSEWYPGCSSCTSHYRVALVQADNSYNLEKKQNRGDAADPFPGSLFIRTVTPETSPASVLYNEASAGFKLSAISDTATSMSVDILIDTVPPITTITASPPALSNQTSGIITFIANESASFSCRLDGLTTIPCTSPFTFSGLSDGTHTFAVEAIDGLANREANPPVTSWTIDTVAPVTAITGAPLPVSSSPDADFIFNASEAAQFFCSLDGSPWQACTSPLHYSGLETGSHTFAVYAVDSATNSGAAAVHSWSVSVPSCTYRVGFNCYATFSEAYAAAGDGETVLVREGELAENISFGRTITVTIQGGYDASFVVRTGFTTFSGSATVAAGTAVFDGIAVR
ncbi:M6 family metalloprotease domain-containing protein [Geobacter sp. DSM 9736]|uniref:M6 family metalloprotease domain-containing protein n=1 Tax=Geobacter sp. DSM 9736 TaxID=1277350 RepID=UPI000B508533|nr:M6 family metalloprotease domain-containing protein [Geobacter sp. DSM 9736]SNB45595.1 M6 family metalloprotease domain-containing protein [Geobacter sp. DSM 9736]